VSPNPLTANTRRLRVGLAGAGVIAEWHARVLKTIPGLEIAAICDPVGAKARQMQKAWGIPQAFESLAAMTREAQLDVVHVLTPPAAHCAAAVEVLEGGCHLFLEKPLGLSVEECERIRSAAGRAGRSVGVNHNHTFNPSFVRLLDTIRSRRLGRIDHTTICFSMPLRQLAMGQHGHWVFQRPGNIILELGVHALSMVYRLMGSVRQVSTLLSGEHTLRNGNKFYDTWQISLACERGTAQCYFAFASEYMETLAHVAGQDGAACADLRRNTLRVSDKSRFLPQVDDLRDAWKTSAAIRSDGVGNFVRYVRGFLGLRPSGDLFYMTMRGSMDSFYGALRSGAAPPIGLEEGTAVVAGAEAIVRAAEAQLRDAAAREAYAAL